jgi:hypothetical protein
LGHIERSGHLCLRHAQAVADLFEGVHYASIGRDINFVNIPSICVKLAALIP